MIYANTSGPISWIYATETTTDSGLSICLVVLYGVILIQTQVSPPLMLEKEEGGVGPENVVYFFSFISLIGAAFMKFWVKESKGLSDKEKKCLFSPFEQSSSVELKQKLSESLKEM